MIDPRPTPARPINPGPPAVACVSYLNAKPLIDNFAAALPGVRLALDVPARQLDTLVNGTADLALCPVIDYYRSPVPLAVAPVGAIGCDGPTLTVRLFSPVPPAEISRVRLDADSHTSVCLLRVVLQDCYRSNPPVRVGLPPPGAAPPPGEARLLIGDKVVTDPPDPAAFPYEVDLGDAWKRLTGRPFVFALWLARRDADPARVRPLAAALERLRLTNAGRIPDIVASHAAAHRWPPSLATDYLGRILTYEAGPAQLSAVGAFAARAAGLGLIPADPHAPAFAPHFFGEAPA